MLVGLASPLTIIGCFALFFGWEPALYLLITCFTISSVLAISCAVLLRRTLPRRKEGTIGFFHPFASGGAGGERVLWCAVRAVQIAWPNLQVVLYVAGEESAEELGEHAHARFNLQPIRPIQVVRLPNWEQLLPETYPRMTLLGQALGSIRVVYSGLKTVVPKVWVDTMGVPFAYPMVRLAGARTVSYTHYPYVSLDMLQRVAERSTMYNNSEEVAGSPAVSLVKLLYYHFLAFAYGLAGCFADVVMVNSSWTKGHIEALWWRLSPPRLVYPPCDTAALQALPLDRKFKRLYLVSVAQFRPEKDHLLQLRALARARALALASLQDPDSDSALSPQAAHNVLSARLKMVGSCRGRVDEARIESLQEEALQLGLANCVEWCVNLSREELARELGGAIGGLHTMLDEHFGISIVEYMAAGVVPIAHMSGGPKEDIITGNSSSEIPGFLCTTVDDYADAIIALLSMDHHKRLKLAALARRKSNEFSDELFCAGFIEALQGFV